MGKKNANGNGTIRKKEITRNGKKYTYWEARYTVGTDPTTGKQIQKSITGKTQKETARKLKEITLEIENYVYTDSSKLKLSQWIGLWLSEYNNNAKPSTKKTYQVLTDRYIVPALGNIKLKNLRPDMVQKFINSLSKSDGSQLAPRTINVIYIILHSSLSQAVKIGYIQSNPANNCVLPKIQKTKIKPLDTSEVSQLISAVDGSRFKNLFILTLFTGLRKAEVMGLQWNCVDFESSSILVDKQLQCVYPSNQYELISTKNNKPRTIFLPLHIIKLLKSQKAWQSQCALKYAPVWQNDLNLVFTDEIGRCLSPSSILYEFKKCAAKIGRSDLRFHDLRHTYAVSALRSGDDIKTIQENLGHATSAFTLDIYVHATDQMKKESAQRMERFIENVMSQ